jgi:hypothetical protein
MGGRPQCQSLVSRENGSILKVAEDPTGSIMSTAAGVLRIYDDQRRGIVAQIRLNGYDIRAGVCTVPHGAMRSFRMVTGDLWAPWNIQAPLILCDNKGREAAIKVAALPAEDDSSGLIEFL